VITGEKGKHDFIVVDDLCEAHLPVSFGGDERPSTFPIAYRADETYGEAAAPRTACKTSTGTRSLLGTHAGAVKWKHLQAYLDEFAFHNNRHKAKGTSGASPPTRSSSSSSNLPARTTVEKLALCQ
jgi:hypothetical protein